jgi:circadian clock protein KaiC
MTRLTEAFHANETPRIQTGVEGLDDILGGGLTPHRLYLVEGVPGAGKTTLSLQFLIEGACRDETVLYVTLSETAEELETVAASHGWSLSGVEIHELVPSEALLDGEHQNTMFYPSEVEMNEMTKAILEKVEQTRPTRVVVDSLSELRLLAENTLRYRRQILALKQYFAGRQCTIVFLDDLTEPSYDLQIQSIAHGVISLEHLSPEYGSERRRLRVVKYRGAQFRGGYHDYAIRRGGLDVFPRLIAAEHRRPGKRLRISSGIAELDALLGGGIEQGTSALIAGPPGTGKSSLAAQFVVAAAENGQHSTMFIFDENIHTLVTRTASLGIDLQKHVDAGLVTLQQVDPAELCPGELAHAIRMSVEKRNASIIVIDSLNGYLNAMPGEQYLAVQLHELLSYLNQMGVAALLIGAHQGLISSQMSSPVDASYLADAILLLRYFEARGEVRQALSIIKKRGGEHERTIREFRMETGRIRVGEPLCEFRGVLTGVPIYEGVAEPLLKKEQKDRP